MTDVAYLIPVEGVAYPFVYEYPADRRVSELVADAYLVASLATPTVYLDHLVIGTGGSPSVDLQLIDDQSNLVFDTTGLTPKRTTWGNWTVLDWVGPTASFKVVLATDILLELAGQSYTGMNLPLVTHCVDNETQKVTGIRFYDATSQMMTTLDASLGVPIILAGGYNTTIATQSSDSGAKLTINVVPGSGLGLAPAPEGECQGPTDVVCTINGDGPDAAGNLQLAATDCHWVEIPHTPATLDLHNDCSPCSDCIDYVNAYKQLDVIYARALTISERFQIALANYNAINGLLGQLETVLGEDKITIMINPVSDRAISILVGLQAGQNPYNSITVTVTYSVGGTPLTPEDQADRPIVPVYVKFSGRKKVPGQFTEVFDYPPGSGFTDNDTFAVGTFGRWSWVEAFAVPTATPSFSGSVPVLVTVDAVATGSGTLSSSKSETMVITMPAPTQITPGG